MTLTLPAKMVETVVEAENWEESGRVGERSDAPSRPTELLPWSPRHSPAPGSRKKKAARSTLKASCDSASARSTAYFACRERAFRLSVNACIGRREQIAGPTPGRSRLPVLVVARSVGQGLEPERVSAKPTLDAREHDESGVHAPICAFTLSRFRRSRFGDLSVHARPISAAL